MPKFESTREPSPADRQAVTDLFNVKCLRERGQPLMAEVLWVLQDRPNDDSHAKLLPEYCYHIFAVMRNTLFKGFPALTDTIMLTDPAGLAVAKTATEAKKVVRVDWKNVGRALGILLRCVRFGEMEAEFSLVQELFSDVSPDKIKKAFLSVFGQQWLAENAGKIAAESPETILTGLLQRHIASCLEKISLEPAYLSTVAYQWSPAALAELTAGISEGMTSFLTNDGELASGSPRSSIYEFLLLVWPEIQAMLEANPKKTLSDLHEWLKPFMRAGLTTYIDIDYLRDVCAPPPSGIGLSLRPLKSRRASA